MDQDGRRDPRVGQALRPAHRAGACRGEPVIDFCKNSVIQGTRRRFVLGRPTNRRRRTIQHSRCWRDGLASCPPRVHDARSRSARALDSAARPSARDRPMSVPSMRLHGGDGMGDCRVPPRVTVARGRGNRVNRRDFLRGAMVGAAASMWPGSASVVLGKPRPHLKGGSILDLPAADCPIDTCRGDDGEPLLRPLPRLARQRRDVPRSGPAALRARFTVDGQHARRRYRRPDGTRSSPASAARRRPETNPCRGCGHPTPATAGTAAAPSATAASSPQGSGNDEFALGYYTADDLAVLRRTSPAASPIFDRYHCSVLGPTYPEPRVPALRDSRAGSRATSFPHEVGYPRDSTGRRSGTGSTRAGVPARYYYTDLPLLALWGARLVAVTRPIGDYFDGRRRRHAAERRRSSTRGSSGDGADRRPSPRRRPRRAAASCRGCVKAFVESPHWHRGVFILTYDEWGGFFDHVAPPRVRRRPRAARSTRTTSVRPASACRRVMRVAVRAAGLRRPPASTTTRSILRFLEWRFLGAPPDGHGRPAAAW